MAGLFGYILAGAAEGAGTSIVDQAKAKRAAALEEMRTQREMEFRRGEREAGQSFQREEREARQQFDSENSQGEMVDLGGGKFGVRRGTMVQPLRSADGNEISVPRSGWRPLTAEEKRDAGIDPKTPAQIGPDGEIKTIGGGGTNIRVDTGTIPAGYRAVRDEEGNILQIEPLPGSPAAADAEQAGRKAEAQGEQRARYADVVTEDIDRALDVMETAILPTTGMAGSWLSNVGGTAARDLDALLTTVRSNVGFDRLQAMREASPTGGALGAVSDFENRQLQSTIGNLEQSQSAEQLKQNLNRLYNVYMDIIHGKGNGPERRPANYSPIAETERDRAGKAKTGVEWRIED